MEIDYNQLVNIGIAGIVLMWFMFRLEDKLEKLDVTLNNLIVIINQKK
jgi:hypothetical protein